GEPAHLPVEHLGVAEAVQDSFVVVPCGHQASYSGVRACRSSAANSSLSNSAAARSYFSIPHDQKSKSIGLQPSWMDAQSVQPYFATSPNSRARATCTGRGRPK